MFSPHVYLEVIHWVNFKFLKTCVCVHVHVCTRMCARVCTLTCHMCMSALGVLWIKDGEIERSLVTSLLLP